MTWLTVSHMWNYIAKSGCDLSIQARLYRAPINHFIAWGLPLRRAWSQWEKASRSGGPCSPDKGDAKWLMWVKDLTIEGMDIWSGHLLGLIVIKKKKRIKQNNNKYCKLCPLPDTSLGGGQDSAPGFSPDSTGTAPAEGTSHWIKIMIRT